MTTADRDRLLDEAERRYTAALDTGDMGDFARAVPWLRRALAVTPLHHPYGVWCRLSLAQALTVTFRNVADLTAIDEAITLFTGVAEVLLPGEEDRKVALANLSGALRARYGYRREPSDIARAVDAIREALSAEPMNAILLINLCTMLVSLYKSSADPADLDAAIEAGDRAVRYAPPVADIRAGALGNLGTALLERYRLRADPHDLDTAIDLMRQSADLLPASSADRVTILGTLADAWRDAFKARGDRADIDRAIDTGRQLVRIAPQLSHRATDFPTALGICLRLRADAFGRADDFDEAIALWRAAAAAPGPVQMRFIAAGLAATNLAERGRLADAVEDYATMVGLLPLLAWRGLDRTARETALKDYPGLVSEAAAAAIAAGDPERAVELLELGRSVLWGQLLDARTDLTALHEAHPQVGAALDRLRERLDGPGQNADERRHLSDEWDRLIAHVRTLDGFERFLLPPPFGELSRAAEDGPIVIVNVNQHRCDALVVTLAGVRVIPLPGLTSSDARDRTVDCLTAIDQLTRDPRNAFRQAVFACLEWMWDTVAGVVLDALGHTPPAAGEHWQRIWWSPTGPLAALPLHAAGYHDPEDRADGATVLDRVISSYTPTLRALVHARRPDPVPGDRRLLVAAVPDPVSYAPAAGPVSATREVALVTAAFPGPCTTLVGAQTTVAGVVGSLPGHPYAHFACHGGQNLGDPGSNALYLYDAPLRLADLLRLDLGAARLAVLSACETALGGIGLFDEAIHLGAAFHLIGYRQVVATLWPVRDSTAPEIAAAAWQDPSRAAAAIHHRARHLRDRHPADPTVWVTHVHLGC
jgi:tetratricopeptide (TPR) repeat protein